MEALPDLQEAVKAEADNDPDKAIKLYEKAIRTGCADERCFNRLMILYRKQQNYRDELKVIEKGIAVYTKKFQQRTRSTLHTSKLALKMNKLSRAFGQKTGLIDKKGKELYLPEPIGRWTKRAVLVKGKLSKAKK